MTESREQAHGTREQALKQRQKKRQQALRRRRRILITCLVAIVVAVALLVVMMVRSMSGSRATETALTLEKDGSVTFEEVMDFDKNTYSKSEMKDFVKKLVDSYDGAGEVTLENEMGADSGVGGN